MYAASVAATIFSLAALSVSASAPSGRICVLSANSRFEGWVSKDYTNAETHHGLYGLTSTYASALEVTVKTPSGGGAVYLEAWNSPSNNANPVLAFIVGPGDSNGYNLDGYNNHYVYLGGVQKPTIVDGLPKGAQSSAGYSRGGLETTIWEFDTSSKHLVTHWADFDDQWRERYQFWDPKGQFFGITGNLTQFTTTYGPGSTQVTFKLC